MTTKPKCTFEKNCDEEVQYSFMNILIPTDNHLSCFLHYCEAMDSIKFLGIEKDWVVTELDSR